jgi:hypothetical protein
MARAQTLELVLGQADALALEVLRLADAVLAHVERGVAEGAREEDRDRHIGAVAARRLHAIAREGQLGDIELLAAHGAKEHLLRVEVHVHRIDAVDLHTAIEQCTRAVVVAHGDGELELGHAHQAFTE